jgi:hypothetical protein
LLRRFLHYNCTGFCSAFEVGFANSEVMFACNCRRVADPIANDMDWIFRSQLRLPTWTQVVKQFRPRHRACAIDDLGERGTQVCIGVPISVDFFAGSGTRGHAVINLYREDSGRRKFVLVEMADFYVAEELAGTYRGMMIALPGAEWKYLAEMSDEDFVAWLVGVAKGVRLDRYAKSPRGPKKPRQLRRRFSKAKHIATSRLLADAKKK